MAEPIVSVVMAVYNGEQYLRQALKSILTQTFADFELIVVDDGSTDSTIDILNDCHDSRLVLLRNEENIGQTRSLNRGLAVAQGRYIARQDADDLSYPARFASQVAYLDAHPEVGLLGSSYNVIDAAGEVIERRTVPTDNDTIQRILVRRNCFAHGSVMMRRDVLARAGNYHEALWSIQDYDQWLRMAEQAQVANLAEPLYAWRYLSTSKSMSDSGRFRESLHLQIYQRMVVRRKKMISSAPGYTISDLAAGLVTLAVSAAILDHWDIVEDSLSEAWQTAPGWLDSGGFAEVTEEALGLTASVWMGWESMPVLFLNILQYLPDGAAPEGVMDVLSHLYRHQSFEAYARQNPKLIRKAAWRYWRRRPLSLLHDRGLASIWFRSWFMNAHA